MTEQAAQRHVIIGTAGHVDHGKTQLIKALTGQETDRLAEEKKRGISIQLGFSDFPLPDASGRAGIVDVPGHERFINNMLAGIGGLDLVLMVVDVNEGVMPQTHEHLQILQLLQIPQGILVLTKCDLVEAEWLELVSEEVQEEVAGTFLEQAPVCHVSSLTGQGIDELKELIARQLQQIPTKDSQGPLRLPVDRRFSVSGFGTVVTGTLLSGQVRPGDEVELLPRDRRARVREVQVHSQSCDQAWAGQRVALNLSHVAREELPRGSVVATPGIFGLAQRLDARLQLLPDAPRPLEFRDPVHFYLNTARVTGKVALLDRDTLEPGDDALVQIHLDQPLVAHRQDRFIIRSYSPVTTIGGGVVIDINPVKHRRFRPEVLQQLEQLEAGAGEFLLEKMQQLGYSKLPELKQASGLGEDVLTSLLESLEHSGQVVALGDCWCHQHSYQKWRQQIVTAVEQFHQQNPLAPGVPTATVRSLLPKKLSNRAFNELLQRLQQEDSIVSRQDRLAREDFTPQPGPADQGPLESLLAAYHQAGVQPRGRQEMLKNAGIDSQRADDYFDYLINQQQLVRLSPEMYIHRQAYAQALAQLCRHFANNDTLSLAQFRDQLQSARKPVQALLEHFDHLKYTLRTGDVRKPWKLPQDAETKDA